MADSGSTGNEHPAEATPAPGALEPLREPTFRGIWIASLFSNFGHLIMGVGAAWHMTMMSSSPSMVALVQTALMLPMMLVALPAGAMADMFDRRKVALVGIGLGITAAAALTIFAVLGLITPWILLAFCFLVGSAVALYVPAWMSSIGEQVPLRVLPQAIALGAISFNIARSFGPAVGGVIVLAMGAKAAYAINATFFIPLLIMYFLWKREQRPSRLPRERIDRAIVAGMTYARHSPPVRTVMARATAFGFTTATIYALTPLVAKDLLGGTAATYGILLGALGIGSVAGATMIGRASAHLSPESIFRLCVLVAGTVLIVISQSRSLPLTCAAMFTSGFCNVLVFSMLNTTVQLAAPRWVTARALSLYNSALMCGMAGGAWIWGEVASGYGVTAAYLASGMITVVNLLLGFVLPLPGTARQEDTDPATLDHIPDMAMNLTMRSGPVVIEIEYDVEPARAREFHEVVTSLGKARKRIGAFDWSISRDIANPAIWVERYQCPTWGDYLRMRDRYTKADRMIQTNADSFDQSGNGSRVRRRLERPYGSVRWRADSPDPQVEPAGYM